MGSDKQEMAESHKRLDLWLAVAWFVFINVVFYWRLFQERLGELTVVWQLLGRLLH